MICIVWNNYCNKIIFFKTFFKDAASYETWKLRKYPTMADVLDEFPSLRVTPTLLLSQMPLLQPRFYSISSSPKMYPGEIHATVAVVTFRTQGLYFPFKNNIGCMVSLIYTWLP